MKTQLNQVRKVFVPHEHDGKRFYLKDGFRDKIQINLANISSDPEDEFRLVDVYYDYNEFDCQLCDHKHCLYAFVVENQQTKKRLTVGSECINHFKGKGIDINLAEGLMKRIHKAVRHSKESLRRKVGEEEWDKLPKEEQDAVKWFRRDEFINKLGAEAIKKWPRAKKAQETINSFMAIQAEELLLGVANGKTILNAEQTERILSLGMEDKLKYAHDKHEESVRLNNLSAFRRDFGEFMHVMKRNFSPIDTEKVIAFKEQYATLHKDGDQSYYEVDIDQNIESYALLLQEREEWSWLLTYNGINPHVVSVQNYFKRYGNITPKQKAMVKKIISDENKNEDHDDEFEKAIGFLLRKNPKNSFYNSVNTYYLNKGYVTAKQKSAILRKFKSESNA